MDNNQNNDSGAADYLRAWEAGRKERDSIIDATVAKHCYKVLEQFMLYHYYDTVITEQMAN